MINNNRHDRNHTRDMKIQDAFLNHCRRDKIRIMIQLVDQSQISGYLVGFDSHSIILDDGQSQHLIYKNAVIAINPQETVNYIFNDAYRAGPLKAGSEYTTDFS